MVNTDDFIKRLEIVLEYYSLNASSFADKIGVQRSSMSHLLSGRNKPSLDFILKIIDFFPEVDLYWMLQGKGTFPKISSVSEYLKTSSEITNSEPPTPMDLFSQISIPEESTNVQPKKKPIEILTQNNNEEKEIEKIVFFYKNGSFKIYSPN